MRKRVDIKKASVYSIVINSIQIAAVIAIALLVLFTDIEKGSVFFIEFIICVAAAVIIWGAVVDIQQALTARHVQEQSIMLEEAYSQLEALNISLRAQRHDFMNHLQVVGSLVEMEEYKDAADYIDRVYGDIESVKTSLKTANPAVNALLKVKLAESQKRGISMELHIQSKWENLPIQGWEMCRVLGNLIDNALDALANQPEPRVLLTIAESPGRYTFCVENNGPQIPSELESRIFQSGFTTKGTERGMGLAIVRSILQGNGGGIELLSTPERTVFSGWLPRSDSLPE